MMTLMSVLTLREFYQLQAGAGHAPFAKLGMFFGALITAAPWLHATYARTAGGWDGQRLLPLALLVICVRILGERPPEKRVAAMTSTLFGLVYVALTLQYFVRLATPAAADPISPGGRLLLCVWIVAVAKFCDTGALLGGMLAGKHPLAPTISPKKTWEGAIAGVLTAVLVGTAIAWFARAQFGALVAIPIAVAGIVSDLVESIIKRHAHIKDSGQAIPGIGGVFDVTDSLLLAAPVGYFLLGLN